MVFTEEDAENDGKIKKEAGRQLNSVLARRGGDLYMKFQQWCDENNRDPSVVLGDMILRAMKDESYTEAVLSTTVEPAKLEVSNMKKEDLEFVMEMIEMFDDGEEDAGADPIDRMIEKRIEAMGSGPLGALNQQNGQVSDKDREIQELRREIQRLKNEGQRQRDTGGGSREEMDETVEVQEESSQTVDDLFEGGDDDSGSDDTDNTDSSGDMGSEETGEGETVSETQEGNVESVNLDTDNAINERTPTDGGDDNSTVDSNDVSGSEAEEGSEGAEGDKEEKEDGGIEGDNNGSGPGADTDEQQGE